MSTWWRATDLAVRVNAQFPDAVVDANPVWFEVKPERLVEVSRFLRDDADLRFEMATNVTSVDWEEYFEVVYHLQSISRNHIVTMKCRPPDYDDPIIPSVYEVWYGAHLQEREVYDLMGIRFAGHPDLRRLFLWEGFSGWPLRKSFLQIQQGQFRPGLPHFPKEGGERGTISGPLWSEQEAGWRPRPTPGVRPPEERRPGAHQQMGDVTPRS